MYEVSSVLPWDSRHQPHWGRVGPQGSLQLLGWVESGDIRNNKIFLSSTIIPDMSPSSLCLSPTKAMSSVLSCLVI